MTDYYQLLNIPRDADRNAIKKAYRQLALQYHPDVRPNDKFAENHFKEISTAYRTLINPVRRAHYDHTHNNIANNPKIYPTAIQTDPATNLMLRIIFLGFGVTLLIIAVQVSLLVHYSNDPSDKPEQQSPLFDIPPEFERSTLSSSQQDAIFNPDLYPYAPTCTLALTNNTHTCTDTTDIHLQFLTADHQAILILMLGDSHALLAITYDENPDGLTLHISNPDSDVGQIQIFNQTLTISGNRDTPPEFTPLFEASIPISQSTILLDISPNTVRWQIEKRAESVNSHYIDLISDENLLYLAFNRGLSDDHQIGTGITSVQIWLLPSPDTR